MIILTALSVSPWSEKARWALDHHRVDYKYEEHIPLLGELRLRLRLRKPSGRVSVPVLYDGQRWLADSFNIAKFADQVGSGARLFPGDKLAEIAEWNRRSEAALAAGRALYMLASASDASLALAFLPPSVPPALRPFLGPVAKKALAMFIAKYRMKDGERTHAATLYRELAALSKALSGKSYLVGNAFSYADIAMAPVVQRVRPVDTRYMASLPGTDNDPDTVERERRYPDLIAWRDELYAKHRRVP